MKKIITHINPDLDAVTSVWLIKRFLPASSTDGSGWEEAEVGFVEATASGEKIPGVDENPNVLYVDVGRGKLDHHQTGKYLSAAKLCWEYIKNQRKDQPFAPLEQEALEQLVEIVTQVDNARDLQWEEIKESRIRFYLHNLIDGLRGNAETDFEVMEFGFRALDAVFWGLKNKIKAQEELKKGIEFEAAWGKVIALETGNKQVLWEGEVQGYVIVIKKDPKTGGVQIYSRWDSGVDLTEAYNKIKELDPKADWFLHASKKLLLNQASVNLNMRPTKLSLGEIIDVFKNLSFTGSYARSRIAQKGRRCYE